MREFYLPEGEKMLMFIGLEKQFPPEINNLQERLGCGCNNEGIIKSSCNDAFVATVE